MISYLLAFSWGFCIVFSLIGWGGIIKRILLPQQQVSWGQRAAWGIAFSVFIGGILNVTWTISRPTILTYLGLGLLYWLLELYRNRKYLITNSLHKHIADCRRDKVIFVGTILVFLLIFMRYAGWVSVTHFNVHDDYHSYFVFPQKMIQTGSMGPDPFSERRIISSLGGQAFLDTFVLSVLSERNLSIIDSGCGLIIAIGLILELLKRKNIARKDAIFILLVFLHFTGTPYRNITGEMIGLSLFLSLFATLERDEKPSSFIANSFIIALTTSAICALKSNLIPACIIFVVSSYLFHILSSKMHRTAVYEFLVTMFLTGMLLVPWMISMYQSSGTLLYPILGKGYHGSAYGNFPLPSSGFTLSQVAQFTLYAVCSADFLALCLLSFTIFGWQSQKLVGRAAPLSLTLGSGLGAILIVLATGGYFAPFASFPSCYSVPFVGAAILVLITIVMSNLDIENRGVFTYSNSRIIAIFLAGMIVGSFIAPDIYLESIYNAKLGLIDNKNFVSSQEIEQYANVLQAVPEKETVLTRLEKPFLLNFKRNRIFIADYPGGASLPPGMPFHRGSESLADYLTSKSIRYVAYSYATEAGFSRKIYGYRLRSSEHNWLRNQAKHTFDFQDSLKQLGKTRKRIYDDGKIFVLDLLAHKGANK